MKKSGILFTGPMVRAIRRDVDPKTQTRRLVKPQPPRGLYNLDGKGMWFTTKQDGIDHGPFICPYGVPGDRLAVRETFFAFGRWETRYSAKKRRDEWHFVDLTREAGKQYMYDADDIQSRYLLAKQPRSIGPVDWHKRPAIFMPREACRIRLEVTRVRVERLQGISPKDATAEGLSRTSKDGAMVKYGIPDRDGLPGTDDIGWPWNLWRISPVDAYRHLWEQINGAGSWAANPWVWAIDFKRVSS